MFFRLGGGRSKMIIRCQYSELVDVDSLRVNPKNPNKHSEEQINMLAKIMRYQGVRQPIVVSKQSGYITKGHGRLAAIVKNGWKQAPVQYQEYEDLDQEYADMVADNEIARLALADMDMIQQGALDLGPDFDFDLLGIPDFKVSGVDTLPPINEKELDENISTENECPKCGYKW